MDSIDKINKLLAEKGMNGAALSRMIGVSSGTYSTWNTKARKISSINLHKIARALDVSVEDLLPDEETTELTKPTDETEDILNIIKDRPEMRILFSKAKDATPEQLFAIAQMIESFKRGDSN